MKPTLPTHYAQSRASGGHGAVCGRLAISRNRRRWQRCGNLWNEYRSGSSSAGWELALPHRIEGIEGERGIAWRAADSLALRQFLELGLTEPPPDHSTISRTRRLIAVETHQAVFRWVLELLAEKGLLKGKTVGIDGTTLEANAAMRSIVRRDTGEGYEEVLRRLAEESGIATPTRGQMAKQGRQRGEKGSHCVWGDP